MVVLKTNFWRGLSALSRRSFVSSCQDEISQTFQEARVGGFRQEAPRHEHAWRSDPVLRAFLGRAIPQEVLEGLEPDLERFGERVVREVGLRIVLERGEENLCRCGLWVKSVRLSHLSWSRLMLGDTE